MPQTKKIPTIDVDHLDVSRVQPGSVARFRVAMVRDGLGDMIRIPVVVLRGAEPGPVVGVTAAVHGNELNGVRIIHRLISGLDPASLVGTIIAVPVVNVPGYLQERRGFNDGQDLNRIMPGKAEGTSADVYAHRFLARIVKSMEYLIDLHTASFGRVNSLYVRANMIDPVTARMAYLQRPDIIVHNEGGDGTLRNAAADLGIHAITVEVGDPLRFQRKMIRFGLSGLINLLSRAGILGDDEEDELDEQLDREPIVCSRSHWMYTDRGGMLQVYPNVGDVVAAGERLAVVTNIFGDEVACYLAPHDAVVIGKSTNPVNQAGARIAHLGIIGERSDFADFREENETLEGDDER